MFIFSKQQRLTAFFLLAFFHIFIITISNYLVQLQVLIFNFRSTWGTLSFPFILLTTDLTIRIFNAALARRIIFAVMVPSLLISYCISAIFYQAEWQGFSALGKFNLYVARIASASFIAYTLTHLSDVYIFDRLRQQASFWIAPTVSMLLSNALDTAIFFFIAFYHSPDPVMAAHWIEIAMVDYSVKVIVSITFFLPLYLALINFLIKVFVRHRAL